MAECDATSAEPANESPWAIEGVYPYYDLGGVHLYDMVRFARPPVTRRDGPCNPAAARLCGVCDDTFVVRGSDDAVAMLLAEEGCNRHGEPYNLLVPICPECCTQIRMEDITRG